MNPTPSPPPLRIAIASGKGGTGKTTLAVNLALAWAADRPVVLADCDVEEPNARLFLRKELDQTEPAQVASFSILSDRCDGCGRCSEVCRFNAIAMVRSRPLVFPEMCHACGGCLLACPRGAVIEELRENGQIGTLREGRLTFVEGRLNVGEAMAVPLIEQTKKKAESFAAPVILYDCPPGTACSMLAAVRGVDFVLLVTEPTPFGLNDLQLAVDALRLLGLRFGVAINRDGSGDDRVVEYCRRESIPLLARLPDDRRVAELYSRGIAAYGLLDVFTERIAALARELES